MKINAELFQYFGAFIALLSCACFGAPKSQPISLQLKPQTCVIPDFSKQCDLTIHFIWHSKLSTNICLFQQKN